LRQGHTHHPRTVYAAVAGVAARRGASFVDLFKLLAIILLIVSVPVAFALFFFWFTHAGSRITRRRDDWD
jgi:hypothetical protein